MPSGLVLLAHGARDPRWAAPFEAVARRIAEQRPQLAVRLAFLEFMAPALPAAAAQLLAEGCRRIVVQPMFLGTGGHVRRDLPLLLDELRRGRPDVRFELATAIGELETVIAAMADAATRATDEGPAE